MERDLIFRSIGKGFAIVLVWILFGVLGVRGATFEIADAAEFGRIIDTNSILTTNATINTWLEGPTWVPSGGGFLVFCDQNNNRLKKLVPPSTVTDFLVPPANTLFNGTLLDARERLISAEAGSAGLKIAMVTNGLVTSLVTTCNGLKFYSPNDVALKSDGTIWFTDPGYNSGIGAPPQAGFQGGYYVYQFNPTNGNATCRAVITNGIIRPNGICFSPDETKLYVADSDTGRHRIQIYSVSASNTLTEGAVFANVTNGIPDGIHCDVDGRVWSSGGDGLYIFAAADGHLIGKIKFIRVVNLCWGGPQYKTLYMVGQPLVTSIPVLVAGIPSLKKLQYTLQDGQLILSWPAPSTGFALQESEQLTPASSWSASSLAITTTNNQQTVTVDAINAAKFFRLKLN
jgi:gluconolactonase